MGGPGAVWARYIACGAGLVAVSGCSILPAELNLSPLYRHRLDADGSVREMDVLWPIFHYRQAEDGGWEFRVRPLYRYVSEGAAADATEHQFLWPLGRVRADAEETSARLLPLWWYKARTNTHGQRETDWWFAILVWGGSREDGNENYFAVLPFYADIPGFLTYERFQVHLFPLHVALEKLGMKSHQFLWPLIGFGSDATGERYWHRVLPFYGVNVDTDKFERYSALWPFLNWGREGLDTEDPISRFFVFPFYGRQTSERVDAWTVLWPFFQKTAIEDRLYKLDVLWPIYRYQTDDSEHIQMRRWWVWPLYGQTDTLHTHSWSLLWPIVWMREFDDPEGVQTANWVVPFYWRVHRDRDDGSEDDFLRLWPFYHGVSDHDGTGEWTVLSLWPWRHSSGDGTRELYGWLWTLAEGRRTPDSSNFDLAAHLFTTAERKGRRQTSVPFLFNYESDAEGATLRLFQFLPIPLGGGSSDGAAEAGGG